MVNFTINISMSYKKCTTCNGEGKKTDDKGKMYKCYFCKGEGIVPANRIMQGAFRSSRNKIKI